MLDVAKGHRLEDTLKALSHVGSNHVPDPTQELEHAALSGRANICFQPSNRSVIQTAVQELQG